MTDTSFEEPEEPQLPVPVMPGAARAASAPRLSPVRTSMFDTPSGTTRRYMGMGFDPDQAYALAQSPNLSSSQVAEGKKMESLIDRFGRLADLDPDQQAKSLQDDFTKTERARLRAIGFDIGEEPKEAGLLGGALESALGVVGGALDVANTATFGVFSKAGGAALEGFEALEEQSKHIWRTLEHNVRSQGWSVLVEGFTPWGKQFVQHEASIEGRAEELFRPNTRAEIVDMYDGDETLADLALKVAKGWDDEQILTTMGYQPESTEYQEQFSALQRLKQTDELRKGVQWAESHKMSPGRTLANLFGLDGQDEGVSSAYTWVSGVTDATYTMAADPTLIGLSTVRALRLSRYMFVGEGTDEFLRVTSELFDSDTFKALNRWGEGATAPPANMLKPGRYFRDVRKTARAHGLKKEQIEAMVFIDHMMAGTKIGSARRGLTAADDVAARASDADAFLDDGLDQVLGHYVKMRPQMQELVYNVQRGIDKGDIFDLDSLIAAWRSAPLAEAMAAGVGRTRFLNAVAPGGMYLPHLTRAGTFRLQARLAKNDVIDWANAPQAAFKLERLGSKFEPEDFGAAELWLQEQMRRTRGATQGSIDDWTDFHKGLAKQGFDSTEAAQLIQTRLVHTLGGKVVGREDPVSSLARIITRDGKIDTSMADEVKGLLRNIYSDDATKADRLIAAFDDALFRYTEAFRPDMWGEARYADTLLDDVELDLAVQGVARETEGAYMTLKRLWAEQGIEVPLPDRSSFTKRVLTAIDNSNTGRLTEGLDDVTAGLVDEVIGDNVSRLITETPKRQLRSGELIEVTVPDEYRSLVAELAGGVLDDLYARGDEARQILESRGLRETLAHPVETAQDLGRLSLKARLNMAMESSLRRAVRIPAKFSRLVPKNPYVDFYTNEGLDDLSRWLDMGVYGPEAEQAMGRFIKGATPGAKRAAVFAAQRQMFENFGILYDPAAQDFVEEVLRAQRQYYGGTTFAGRNVALLPQAHSATAMRIHGVREILPHLQRSRFMQLMSPRFGTLGRGWFGQNRNYFQAFNHVWRQLAIWRPALAPRVTLDENLTLIGREGLASFRGDNGFVNRIYMGAKYRAWAAKVKRGMRVTRREVGEELPGRTGIEVSKAEADDIIAKMRSGKATMEERTLAERFDMDARAVIDNRLLDGQPQLWKMPRDQLRDVLDEAEIQNLWAAKRKVLEMDPTAYTSESGKLRHRLGDALLDRFVPDITEETFDFYADAMSTISGIPAVRASLESNVSKVGLFPSKGGTENLASANLDDLGRIELELTGQNIPGTVDDPRARESLLRFLQQVSRDGYGRDVVAPAVRMHLPTPAKGALRETLRGWERGATRPGIPRLADVTVADPFALNVTHGFLAPVVEIAARNQDMVAWERARWLALDSGSRAAIRQGGEFTDESLDSMLEAVQRYQRGTVRLSESSELYVKDRAQLRQMIDDYAGLNDNQRGALLVDDRAVRPSVPGAALMDQRFGNSSRFGIDPDNAAMLQDGARGFLRAGGGEGRFGAGFDVVMPRRANRFGPSNPDTTGGWRISSQARFLNLDRPIGNEAVQGVLTDAVNGLDQAMDLRGTLAARLNVGDPESVKDVLSTLPEMVNALRASGEVARADRALTRLTRMYDDLAEEGVYGVVSGQAYEETGYVARGLGREGEELHSVVAAPFVENTDTGAVFTIFDRRAVERPGADRTFSREAWLESMATPEGELRSALGEWAEIVAGDLDPLDSRVWRQTAREHLLHSNYWEWSRHHDTFGPAHGHVDIPRRDEAIVHVPRRNGSAPQLRDDQRWLENELEQVAEGFEEGALVGSVNIDHAQALLRNAAGKVGDDPSMWHLVEVRVPTQSLRARRAAFFDSSASRALPDGPRGGVMPREFGPGAERITHENIRRSDQLLVVGRHEADSAALQGRFGLDDTDRIFLSVDDPGELAAVGDEWFEALQVGDDSAVLSPLLEADNGVDAMRIAYRDSRIMNELVRTNPEAATEAALLAVVDEFGTGAIRAQYLDDGAPELLRIRAGELAGRTEVPAEVWERVAANAVAPEWWTTGIDARRAAKVSRTRSLDVTADEFVSAQVSDLRSLLYGGQGNDAEPLYELLAEAEKGGAANLDDVMRGWHGKMPEKVIRPMMKVKATENKAQTVLNWGFKQVTHFVAELSRYPMFGRNFAKNFDAARKIRLRTPRFTELEGRMLEHFDPKVLSHKIRNAQADLAPHLEGATTSYTRQLRTRIEQNAGILLDDVPPALHEDFIEYLGLELRHRAEDAELAMRRTLGEISPFIDDHRIRSQAADAIDDVWPFFYATEQFAKRWLTTAYAAPEAFRRLQLYYHGAKASGVVYTDENGEDMVDYPMSGFLTSVLGGILKPGAANMIPSNNLQGRASGILPGLDEGLRFSAGPAITVPFTLLRPYMGDEMQAFEKAVGGKYLEGKSPLDQVLPSWVTRFRKRGSDEIAAMTFIAANHPELIPGWPDEEGNITPPTLAEEETFKGRVRQVARILATARGVTGFVGPTSPRVEIDPDELSEEFFGYLDTGMPYDIALGEFLRAHPNALAHTMLKTSTTSGAPATASEEVFEALRNNDEFYGDYALAGPWLLPNSADDDEFSQDAWSELVSIGYRDYKDLDDWFVDFKFAQGANIYFPSQEAKDRMLEALTDPAEKTALNQAWAGWVEEFEMLHPIFMEQYLGQEGRLRRGKAREEMELALIDQRRPELPQSGLLAELLVGFKRLQQVTSDRVSYTVEQRRSVQEAFHQWASELTAGDPMARGFYRRNMLQDLDIDPKAEEV